MNEWLQPLVYVFAGGCGSQLATWAYRRRPRKAPPMPPIPPGREDAFRRLQEMDAEYAGQAIPRHGRPEWDRLADVVWPQIREMEQWPEPIKPSPMQGETRRAP